MELLPQKKSHFARGLEPRPMAGRNTLKQHGNAESQDDNATSPAPCSLAPSGENSPSPWSRPVPRPPQLKFEVISRCKVKVRHPALKGQNNIAPGTRPGRQYIPLVFSSGSRDMGSGVCASSSVGDRDAATYRW